MASHAAEPRGRQRIDRGWRHVVLTESQLHLWGGRRGGGGLRQLPNPSCLSSFCDSIDLALVSVHSVAHADEPSGPPSAPCVSPELPVIVAVAVAGPSPV